MSSKAGQLLREATALSFGERAELASPLIDRLDLCTGEDVEVAWQEEITRRVAEVRAGRATMIPWEEVRRKAPAVPHAPKSRSLTD